MGRVIWEILILYHRPIIVNVFLTFNFSVWSKIIILHAPALRDMSPEKQEEIDEILQMMNREGTKFVLYNMSFARMFDDYEAIRHNAYR